MAVDAGICSVASIYEEVEHFGGSVLPLPYAQLTRLIKLLFLCLVPISTVRTVALTLTLTLTLTLALTLALALTLTLAPALTLTVTLTRCTAWAGAWSPSASSPTSSTSWSTTSPRRWRSSATTPT